MSWRDYALFLEGRNAAAQGAGLSGAPYAGRDGDLWRDGVRAWLKQHAGDDEREPETSGAQAPRAQP